MQANPPIDNDRSVHRDARPVSRLRSADVIDAEFVHVDDAGEVIALPGSARNPMRPPVAVQFPTAQASSRLGVFAGEMGSSQNGKPLKQAGFLAAFLALVVGCFWFAGGHTLIPMVFGSGSDNLHLSDITTHSIAGLEGQAVLVEGTINNSGGSALDVPLVAIQAPGKGDEPLYVRAPKKRLAAGESTRFRVRVSPQARGYRELTVSLAGGSTGR